MPSDERRIICIFFNVDIDYTDDIPMAAKTPRPGKLYYPFIRNWLVESSSNRGDLADRCLLSGRASIEHVIFIGS